jgi:hypothetical protein
MLQGGELIRVTASPMSPNSEPVHCAIGREAVRCVTSNEQNSWFIIDFRDWLVSPTHYTLRHYSTWDTEGLRTWRLSGSSDGKQHNWVTLMEHRNDTSLDAKGKAHTWAIPQSAGFYRFFCIIQTGKNANDNYFLPLSGAEFYGRFYHQPRR